MKKSTDPRHQARRLALAYLYSYTISNTSQDLREIQNTLGISNYDQNLFNLLTNQYLKYQNKTKSIAKKYLTTWPEEQLLDIDLIIINLAILESFILKKIPYKVSVDEAVELAKEFSTEKSGKFVNGVLAKVIKEKINKENE